MPPKYTHLQALVLARLRDDPAACLVETRDGRVALWSGGRFLRRVYAPSLAKFLRQGLLRAAPAAPPFCACYVWRGQRP